MEELMKKYFELIPKHYKDAFTVSQMIRPIMTIIREEVLKEKEKLRHEMKEYYRSYK